MFDSVNTNPDYTFTNSDNRLGTNETLKILTKFFENADSNQNGQLHSVAQKTAERLPSSDQANLIKKTKDKDKESDFNVSNLFKKDEDSEDENNQLLIDKKTSSITVSFDSLAAAVGASDDKVSKSQLIAFLQILMSEKDKGEDKNSEIAFLKSLIAKFDTLSKGEDYITSFHGVKDPQDYTTITKEQVTPPIDIRI